MFLLHDILKNLSDPNQLEISSEYATSVLEWDTVKKKQMEKKTSDMLGSIASSLNRKRTKVKFYYFSGRNGTSLLLKQIPPL